MAIKKKYKQKFFRHDFKGQDLTGQDFSYTEFICCNFQDADLSNANCSYCDFTGSYLMNTKCTYTDFSHTCLACVFEPRDCYGITWTMECRTFTGMHVSKLWWYCYLHFGMLMKPKEENGVDLRDKLLLMMGKDVYMRLKSLFLNREL